MSLRPPGVLGKIGDAPYNEFHLQPLSNIYVDDVPAAGFVGSLSLPAAVSQMKGLFFQTISEQYPPVAQCGNRLQIDDIDLIYEGKGLDSSRTLKENGIMDQGPAARRSGAKIEIFFMFRDGVELPAACRRRMALEESEAAARTVDEAQRARGRAAAQAEVQAKVEADEAKHREAEAEARRADQVTVRCAQLGGGEGREVVSTFATTVSDFAEQVKQEMGVQEGHLTLMFNDTLMGGSSTLRAAGIEELSEIMFYWEA